MFVGYLLLSFFVAAFAVADSNPGHEEDQVVLDFIFIFVFWPALLVLSLLAGMFVLLIGCVAKVLRVYDKYK